MCHLLIETKNEALSFCSLSDENHSNDAASGRLIISISPGIFRIIRCIVVSLHMRNLQERLTRFRSKPHKIGMTFLKCIEELLDTKRILIRGMQMIRIIALSFHRKLFILDHNVNFNVKEDSVNCCCHPAICLYNGLAPD